MNKIIHSYDEYPSVLTPSDIQSILNISRTNTYRILNNNPPFHVTRIGKKMLVSKEVFIKWLEGK